VSGLTFEVRAVPSPQGSKRHVGHGIMVESAGQKLKSWREAVRSEAAVAMNHTNTLPLMLDPVAVTITFFLPRPKAHYGAKGLKNNAPVTCAKRPDVDKLLRSTLDALTSAGVYGDDSQVVSLTGTKMYAGPARTGAVITVRPLP
jgi:crossover junction endodeoxyribonuclease RusA